MEESDDFVGLGLLTPAANLALEKLEAEAGKGLGPRLLAVLARPATWIVGVETAIAAGDVYAQRHVERQRYLSAVRDAMERFHLPKTPDGLAAAQAYAYATEKFRSLEPKPSDESESMRPYHLQGCDSINSTFAFWDGI
jgi:hypothetical protein